MITNKGTNILAKYLIGQAPAYASFVSVGIGPKPLGLNDANGNYQAKTEMDFEVLRVPISSRGYIYDDQGNASVVFVGELPTDQRYEFSEIGIFSAKSNPAAGSYGSRMLYTFSDSESWEFHGQDSAVGIVQYLEPLYLNDEQEQSIILVPDTVFRTNPDNAVFNSDIRLGRYERSRFLDRTMLIRGDMSTLETVNGRLSLVPNDTSYNSTHIHLAGVTPNLNKNAPGDELRLAFSVVNKLDTQTQALDSVKILIEFASTDAIEPDNFARMEIDLGSEDVDFSANRYVIAKSKLEDLVKSAGFTWTNVNIIKIYVSVYEQALNPEDPPVLSDNFYVALDGLRFENLTAISPLYGLTGYSVIKNSTSSPIVKQSNSSNLVEFRFGLDVA